MAAFPDYEELNKTYHVWKNKLSKRASIIYADTTKYIKIDGISYYRNSIEKIMKDEKGFLTIEDIHEVYDTKYYLSDSEMNTVEKYYKIDIINNKITLLTQNDEAIMFTCSSDKYMKLYNKIVPLSSVISAYKNKIEKFLNEKIKPKQRLLMFMFKNDTIKLYNHINNDLSKHDLQNLVDKNDMEQIKNISIITVEKAIELELKLDFNTKTLEKLPLII